MLGMLSRLAVAHVPVVLEMSTGAASIAITVALAVGWYAAKWHRAELDEIRARASLATAVRVMWAARWVILGVGFVGWVVSDLWFHGKGR